MFIKLWDDRPSTGPTEKAWNSALKDIRSEELSIRLNVVSDLRSFLRAAGQEPSIGTMYGALRSYGHAREAVLNHLYDISKLDVDPRYENPNDAALALLLWLTATTAPDLAQIAAGYVDRAPQCWYAKKVARRLLTPPPVESGDAQTAEARPAPDTRTVTALDSSLVAKPPLEPPFGLTKEVWRPNTTSAFAMRGES